MAIHLLHSAAMAALDTAGEVERAFWLVGSVSLVMLVGITVAMIWFAVRFRRSRARTTRQIHGHTVLEIAWIVVPTIIVMWMFAVGYKGFEFLRTVPPDAMTVQVAGRQWSWSFNYPEQGVSSGEMFVPVGRAVRVELNSDDVLHSFFIPDMRIKEDAVPGRPTHLWFRANREGEYNIFCAEFCGKDHSRMISLLHAVPPAQFEQWVRKQIEDRYRPLTFAGYSDPKAKDFGELSIEPARLFATYCASCHGSAGDGSGLPGLARNFTAAAGWRRGRDVADIYRTLTEGVAGTQMRPFPNLTPWQRVGLAHYVQHFMADPPASTREQFETLVTQYELDKAAPPGRTLSVEQAMELLVREGRPPPATQPED